VKLIQYIKKKKDWWFCRELHRKPYGCFASTFEQKERRKWMWCSTYITNEI